MNKHRISVIASVAVVGFLTAGFPCGAQTAQDSILAQQFDLSGARSAQVQFFEMESRMMIYAPDGQRVNTDIFRLRLKCVPAALTGNDRDEYTCTEFTVQFGTAPEVAIPALRNWTYPFGKASDGVDDKGQVFGIEHAKFEGLTDANGQAIPQDRAYHVYNAFIDFHAFCDNFARPVPAGGKGIQHLKKIGDEIVHAAAFSEPPVHVGSNVEEGSTFKNGRVTLALKGLSRIDGATCALVAYDSGQSSIKMLVKPAPDMEVRTVGSSHYQGDLYIDLATQWVRKATMYELIVAETTLTVEPHKINAVVERAIEIRNVTGKGQVRPE